MPSNRPDFRYYKSCVDHTDKDVALLDAMVETGRQIRYRTMLRNVPGFIPWAIKQFGYAKRKDQGLTVREDYAVAFYKGTYAALPCYWFEHSRIKYIFLPAVFFEGRVARQLLLPFPDRR